MLDQPIDIMIQIQESKYLLDDSWAKFHTNPFDELLPVGYSEYGKALHKA
jgi:hypothetical protein